MKSMALKAIKTIGALLAAATIMTGCAALPTEQSTPMPQSTPNPLTDIPVQNGGQLTLSVGKYNTLNPLLTDNVLLQTYLTLVCERLIELDTFANPVPGILTSWIGSTDSTVWEFKIKEGVMMHNGLEVTADDVVNLTNYIKTRGGNYEGNLRNVNICLKKDKYTVQFFLNEPDGSFPSRLCIPLVSGRTLLLGSAGNMPIGAGPYFVLGITAQQIILSKNAAYYEKSKRPKFDTIIINKTPTSSTADDFSLVFGNSVPAEMITEESLIVPFTSDRFTYLSFNCSSYFVKEAFEVVIDEETLETTTEMRLVQKNNIFSDAKMRCAIASFTDAEELMRAGFGDDATIQVMPSFGGIRGFNVSYDKKYYSNVDGDEIMNMFGYAFNKEKKMYLDKLEEGIVIDAICLQSDTQTRLMMLNFVQQMKKNGIMVNLRSLNASEYALAVKNREYMIMPVTVSLGNFVDFDLIFSSNGAMNLGEYKNEIVDSYISQLKKISAPEIQSAGFNEIAEIILKEAPIIGVCAGSNYLVLRSNIGGIDTKSLTPWNPLGNFYKWGFTEVKK